MGDVEVLALSDALRDGPWPLPEAFPDVPPEQWRGIAERYPETVAGDNWRAHDYCFLVRTSDRTILVDTGIGPPGAQVAEFLHPGGGRLLDELRDAGASPDDVDLVVLTHMHFDHIGWNVGGPPDDPMPTFPHATYLLQQAEWNGYAGDDDPMGKPARDRQVRWLRDAGVLELVDGEREIADGVRLIVTAGHTPGSQSVRIGVGRDSLTLSGDVANHPLQVRHPEHRSFADADPGAAEATRRSFLEAAERDRAILGPAHFPEPFGRVVDGRWVPVGD